VNIRRYEIDNVTKSILFPYRITENKACADSADESQRSIRSAGAILVRTGRHSKAVSAGNGITVNGMRLGVHKISQRWNRRNSHTINRQDRIVHTRPRHFYYSLVAGVAAAVAMASLSNLTQGELPLRVGSLEFSLVDTIVKSVSSPFANVTTLTIGNTLNSFPFVGSISQAN